MTQAFQDYLDGTYDCVDRVVLNAYFPLSTGGGFRTWWRRLFGNDETLDNAHLMRFAGHFSRRVRAWAKGAGIPVVHCERGQRKHEIAGEFLPKATDASGVFCILVGRAPAPLREVRHASNGQPHISIKKPYPFANHYFFHIMDPEWGHLIIRFCPHPPFPAQIILNGHEYVARKAQEKGIAFSKEENCFTHFSNAADLASVAETMSAPGAEGRLTKLCERWIYSACLCFALTTEEQTRSGFHYAFSVYQCEYSRNLLFTRGRHMEQVFDSVIDRTRASLGIKTLNTIFGYKHRPYKRNRDGKPPRFEARIERPAWDLTVFKVHFGRLTAKIYSKGERVLRIECIAHNVKDLRCGCVIARFSAITATLRAMLERFMSVLRHVDASFIHNDLLQQLPQPALLNHARVPGIDANHPRMRAVMAALVTLAPAPKGFSASQLAKKVNEILPPRSPLYRPSQAAYDLRKLRAKHLVRKEPYARTYILPDEGLRSIAALHVLREKIIEPLLANGAKRRMGRKPKAYSILDQQYDVLQANMQQLFQTIGIAA
jgi:hypothetical protein